MDDDVRYDMTVSELQDEVMLMRAKDKVQQNHIYLQGNEIYSLRQQLAALTCACCDRVDLNMDEAPMSARDIFPSECPANDRD